MNKLVNEMIDFLFDKNDTNRTRYFALPPKNISFSDDNRLPELPYNHIIRISKSDAAYYVNTKICYIEYKDKRYYREYVTKEDIKDSLYQMFLEDLLKND